MQKNLNFKSVISLGLVFTFLSTSLGPMPVYASAYAIEGTGNIAQNFSINQLPVPGTMVGESAPFSPLALKGLIVNPEKPLEFQFIVDTGDNLRHPGNNSRHPERSEGSQQEQLKQQANQLVKYFLAGLTIPEGDLWVNLSPYEKNRMVPAALGQTDLGRDLLAQDYILKQLTASLIYPEKDLGKEFWSKVYAKAQQQFGTTNIPVNTFNKVWILPDQAQVFEHGPAAYVTKATLKVMLDEDYLSLQKHHNNMSFPNAFVGNLDTTHFIASQIVREIILPEITKEVNTGKNFAPLRQIYQALILAKWYKETIQNGLLDAVYTNKNKIGGVNLNDPLVKEQIYNRYLQAYKKGAFNYIKEDPTSDGQIVPRKYFSGGTLLAIPELDPRGTPAMISRSIKGLLLALTISLASFIPMGSINAQTFTTNSQTARVINVDDAPFISSIGSYEEANDVYDILYSNKDAIRKVIPSLNFAILPDGEKIAILQERRIIRIFGPGEYMADHIAVFYIGKGDFILLQASESSTGQVSGTTYRITRNPSGQGVTITTLENVRHMIRPMTPEERLPRSDIKMEYTKVMSKEQINSRIREIPSSSRPGINLEDTLIDGQLTVRQGSRTNIIDGVSAFTTYNKVFYIAYNHEGKYLDFIQYDTLEGIREFIDYNQLPPEVRDQFKIPDKAMTGGRGKESQRKADAAMTNADIRTTNLSQDDLIAPNLKKIFGETPRVLPDFVETLSHFMGPQETLGVDLGTGDGWFINKVHALVNNRIPLRMLGTGLEEAHLLDNKAFLQEHGPKSMDFVTINAPYVLMAHEPVSVATQLVKDAGLIYFTGWWLNDLQIAKWLLEQGYYVAYIHDFNNGPGYSNYERDRGIVIATRTNVNGLKFLSNQGISIFKADAAMTSQQQLTLAQKIKSSYTLDPDKANALIKILENEELIRKENPNGSVVLTRDSGEKLVEISSSEGLQNTRFFDLNGRWIMSVDKFDNVTEQLQWDKNGSFIQARILNGNRQYFRLKGDSREEIDLEADNEEEYQDSILHIYASTKILDDAGFIYSASGSEYIPKEAKGVGVLALNIFSQLAWDKRNPLIFVGSRGLVFIEGSLKEVAFLPENENRNFLIDHSHMLWEADPLERAFNPNGICVSWAPKRKTLMRVFYQGNYFYNQKYLLTDDFVETFRQVELINKLMDSRSTTKSPLHHHMMIVEKDGNFELWMDSDHRVATIDKFGDIVQSNVNAAMNAVLMNRAEAVGYLAQHMHSGPAGSSVPGYIYQNLQGGYFIRISNKSLVDSSYEMFYKKTEGELLKVQIKKADNVFYPIKITMIYNKDGLVKNIKLDASLTRGSNNIIKITRETVILLREALQSLKIQELLIPISGEQEHYNDYLAENGLNFIRTPNETIRAQALADVRRFGIWLRERIKILKKSKKQFNIIITGKPGTGKSTFVRNILKYLKDAEGSDYFHGMNDSKILYYEELGINARGFENVKDPILWGPEHINIIELVTAEIPKNLENRDDTFIFYLTLDDSLRLERLSRRAGSQKAYELMNYVKDPFYAFPSTLRPKKNFIAMSNEGISNEEILQMLNGKPPKASIVKPKINPAMYVGKTVDGAMKEQAAKIESQTINIKLGDGQNLTVSSEDILARDPILGTIVRLNPFHIPASQIDRLDDIISGLRFVREWHLRSDGFYPFGQKLGANNVNNKSWGDVIRDDLVTVIVNPQGWIRGAHQISLWEKGKVAQFEALFTVNDGVLGKGTWLFKSELKNMQEIGVSRVYFEVSYDPANVFYYQRRLDEARTEGIVASYDFIGNTRIHFSTEGYRVNLVPLKSTKKSLPEVVNLDGRKSFYQRMDVIHKKSESSGDVVNAAMTEGTGEEKSRGDGAMIGKIPDFLKDHIVIKTWDQLQESNRSLVWKVTNILKNAPRRASVSSERYGMQIDHYDYYEGWKGVSKWLPNQRNLKYEDNKDDLNVFQHFLYHNSIREDGILKRGVIGYAFNRVKITTGKGFLADKWLTKGHNIEYVAFGISICHPYALENDRGRKNRTTIAYALSEERARELHAILEDFPEAIIYALRLSESSFDSELPEVVRKYYIDPMFDISIRNSDMVFGNVVMNFDRERMKPRYFYKPIDLNNTTTVAELNALSQKDPELENSQNHGTVNSIVNSLIGKYRVFNPAMTSAELNLQLIRSFYEEQGYGQMRTELTIAQTWIEPYETTNETWEEALEQMRLIARTVKRFNIQPKDAETLFSLKYLVMIFNRNIKDLEKILGDPDVRPEIIRMLVDGAHAHGVSIKIFNELKDKLKIEKNSQKGKDGSAIMAGLPAINTVAPVKFKLSTPEKSGHIIEAQYDGELQNFHPEATYYLTDDGYLVVSDMRSNLIAINETNRNKIRDWGTRLLQEIKKIAQQHVRTILYPSFPVHGSMYLYHGTGSVVLYRQFCKLPYDSGFRLATANINRPPLLKSTLVWVFKSNKAMNAHVVKLEWNLKLGKKSILVETLNGEKVGVEYGVISMDASPHENARPVLGFGLSVGDYHKIEEGSSEVWLYKNLIIEFVSGELSVLFILGNKKVAVMGFPKFYLSRWILDPKQKEKFESIHSGDQRISNLKSVAVNDQEKVLLEEMDGSKEEIALDLMYEDILEIYPRLYAVAENMNPVAVTDAITTQESLETFLVNHPDDFVKHLDQNKLLKPPENIIGKDNIEKELFLNKKLGPGQVQLFNMAGERISFNLIEREVKDDNTLTILCWKDGSRSLVYKTVDGAMIVSDKSGKTFRELFNTFQSKSIVRRQRVFPEGWPIALDEQDTASLMHEMTKEQLEERMKGMIHDKTIAFSKQEAPQTLEEFIAHLEIDINMDHYLGNPDAIIGTAREMLSIYKDDREKLKKYQRILNRGIELKCFIRELARRSDVAQTTGGIDLNRINVKRTGKTINVQFDQAQLSALEQSNFKGFKPVITGFRYISSPFPLLGIDNTPKESEILAKA